MKEFLENRAKYLALIDGMRTPIAIVVLTSGLCFFRYLNYWNAFWLYAMLGCAVVMNMADVHLQKKEEALFYDLRPGRHARLWRVRLSKLIFDVMSQVTQLLLLAYIFAYFLRGV